MVIAAVIIEVPLIILIESKGAITKFRHSVGENRRRGFVLTKEERLRKVSLVVSCVMVLKL